MKELFSSIPGMAEVREHEPLSQHTTFRIGGACDLMVFPQTFEALVEVLRLCRENKLATFVLGRGSNVLVSDKGIRGVVIATERLRRLLVEGSTVTASAGLSLIDVSKACAELGLSGLEFASGIPGSIGGACYMNAGAYGGEMEDVITSVTVLDENGEINELAADEMCFSYRHSRLKDESLICLAVTMQLVQAEKTEILARIAELKQSRADKQPLELPSAGSTFKRPKGHYAGPLIIEAGLQGAQIGGAQVSTKHAGFLVNAADATADDVITLIYKVQTEVLQKSKVPLETEVRFIGEWEDHPLYHKVMKAQ